MAKGYKNPEYTEIQKTEFLALAQQEGVAAAIRMIGYPTYSTAMRWVKDRGIDVTLSSVMEIARKSHVFYQTEDLVQNIEEVMDRILLDVRTREDISADDFNKYTNALAKMVDKHLVLKGKASSISESRGSADIDSAVNDLVNEMSKRNKEEKEQQNN